MSRKDRRRRKTEATPVALLLHEDTCPKRRRPWGLIVSAGFLVGGLTALSMVGATGTQIAVKAWESLPVEIPDISGIPERTQLLDRNGKVFAEFSTTNRVSITFEQIPQVMIDAIVATEDKDFFKHSGVDFTAVARAMVSNANGNELQGGSTITQQWVKNVLASTAEDEDAYAAAVEQSWARKVREAKLALIADNEFTKEDVLTSYLNTVYFGEQAYGLYAASRHYFSVDPIDLNVNQAAVLAGLVQAPSAYAPTKHKKAAKQRRNQVLERMHTEGYITARQLRQESAKPIRLKLAAPDSGCANSKFPHYCAYVQESLLSDPALGETPEERQRVFDRGGLTVRTALDPAIQKTAIEVLQAHVGVEGDVAAAAAIVKPGTSEVVAIATNREYGDGEYQTEITYANSSLAPLGSNFKPIVLAAALERGFPLSTTFDTPSGYYPAGMHAPIGGFQNANRGNNGVLDARGAVRGSVNTWFIQLIERIGTKPVVDFAERLGMTTLPTKGDGRITEQDATLALGTYDANPLEVATIYATFAAHGRTCRPSPILSIRHNDGSTQKVAGNQRCYQGTTAAVADSVANILTAPFEGGTASSLGLEDGRPTGGKTGTTDNSSATWFSGFTPQYAMTVWVGDPRGGFAYPLQNRWINGSYYGTVYGATIAGPIWQGVMNSIHEGLPIKKLPSLDDSVAVNSVPGVPDLAGLTAETATDAANKAGFEEVVIEDAETGEYDYLLPGMVAKQHPTPGSELPVVSRNKITLTVVPEPPQPSEDEQE
ncbi:MAG: penicillin-binding protein [Actinobacteria bacterium]|nr:penicillin-binding protein [Actinomycetota bacterium]